MVTERADVIESIHRSAEKKLSTFILAKYRFHAEFIQPFSFKGYKGSIFHGGFGLALKTISPSTYQYFFQPPFSGDPPKPYIITPPLDQKESYKPGDTFTIELVLIGPAVQHFPICFAAFEKLGELGIGKERAKFKLTQADYFNDLNQQQPNYKDKQWKFVDANNDGYALSRITEDQPNKKITLNFTSYLRLKNNAKLVTETPSFRLLMDRLLGRLCTLSKYYGQESEVILHRDERLQLLSQAEDITTFYHNMKWQEWTRYSGSQKTEMKFGGLVGSVQYRGELAPFIPYLKLGQWLHVGGKTSFGLGGYALVTE